MADKKTMAAKAIHDLMPKPAMCRIVMQNVGIATDDKTLAEVRKAAAELFIKE